MDIQLSSLSVAELKRAIAIKEQIESLEKQLTSVLGGKASTPSVGSTPKKKRTMSAAARARIAAAQRARWAKQKQSKAAPRKAAAAAKAAPKAKRKLSPAARARIAKLTKARWAKARAAGKTKLQST